MLRGIGGRLSGGRRPAVLVIDLIYGFTDPQFPAGANLDAVVVATRLVLDAARAVDVPIVFTTIVFPPELVERLVWLRKMPALRGLQPRSRWIEVDDRLGRRAHETLLVKQAASAFTGTILNAVLTSFQVDCVLVCGATTSGCVRATVVDACMSGWPVFVPRECVGDRASAPHEASLFDIDAKYGDLLSVEDAISLVLRQSVTP